MDPEMEIRGLLDEEGYVSALISQLEELYKYKRYSNCLPDAAQLIKKLNARKANIKDRINEISQEIIATAEAFAGIDFAAMDAECEHSDF